MKLNTTFPLKEISTVQDDAIKWYYLNFVQFCCLQIPREGEGEDSGEGKCASPKGSPGYVPHVAQLSTPTSLVMCELITLRTC